MVIAKGWPRDGIEESKVGTIGINRGKSVGSLKKSLGVNFKLPRGMPK